MIEFHLDARSGVAPYRQLIHQVRQALRLGLLREGDQLPKVRDVVAALAINPNTVLKAYKELETKGLTAGRPGQGTFVQATLSQVALLDLTALRRQCDELRMRGALIALDDAGSGYSGLQQLAALRPQVVKLDRALTTSFDRDKERRALFAATIELAKEAGLTAVAVGIETNRQLALARQLDC